LPQFLEDIPPDTEVLVVNAVERRTTSPAHSSIVESRSSFALPATDIQLHCENPKRGGNRRFSFECPGTLSEQF
jgi:hypothetical protein